MRYRCHCNGFLVFVEDTQVARRLGQAQVWKFEGTTSASYALLRDGAKLVKTAANIFEEFGIAVSRSGEKAVPAANSAQGKLLLEDIVYVPTLIDHIVERS